MCGIAGIINFNHTFTKKRLEEYVFSMGESLSHRGPDDYGLWTSKHADVAFAHRRLSIIDLSAAGKQPLLTSDQRYVITFNGEIYNHNEIRAELRKKGVAFRTSTDTEVLLEAFREWGNDCLSHLDGMFAFVIYDTLTRKIFAARDPFGEKPFYYTWIKGTFVFASELHALTQVPGFNLNTNIDRVSEYLALQYFDSERTFYNNAYKLLPGSAFVLDNNAKFQQWQYFSFEPGSKILDTNINTNDLVDELEDILLRSLKRRLTADVPVGAFLSGGIDSATVVALLCKKLNFPVQTFTTGFSGVEESEHLAARELAYSLGTEHREQILDPEEVMRFSHVGKILDEPNGDTSLLPTWLLSKFARKHVKVAISGDGADELFGGYSRYWTTLNDIKSGLTNMSAGEKYYSSRILVCPENSLKKILGIVPPGTLNLFQSLRSEIDTGNGTVFDRIRASDVRHYMPGAVLAKVDRMSMQNGLEVRTPFLNTELARFVEKVPTHELINEHEGKLLLKKLAARYLPDKWVKRKKMGFGIPQQQWADTQLRKAMSSSLDNLDYRGMWWLKKSGMKQLLEASISNNTSITYPLWSTLVLLSYLKHHKHIAFDEEGLFVALGKIYLSGSKNRSIAVFSSASIAPLAKILPDNSCVISPYDRTDNSVKVFRSENYDVDQCDEFKKQIKTGKRVYVIGTNDNYDEIIEQCEPDIKKKINYFDGERWSDEKYDSLFFANEKPVLFDPVKRFMVSVPRLVDLQYSFKNLPVVHTFFKNEYDVEKKQDFIYDNIEFWRADTPKRTMQLVIELTNYIKWLISEKRIHLNIKKWIIKDNIDLKVSSIESVRKTRHIVFIISSLSAGGAERQLRNLAVELDNRGYRVTLITMTDSVGRAGHYLPMFAGSNVKVVNASEPAIGAFNFDKDDTRRLMLLSLISKLPPEISYKIWSIYTYLKVLKPDVVHCFLDYPNILGGFAALAARSSRVILSFRNSNPSHFFFHQQWYKRYYKLLKQSDRVILSGNSKNGNNDYARWLGVSQDKVQLTRNGLDFDSIKRPDSKTLHQVRKQFDLSGQLTPVICGIFRFLPEKRPLFFLEVVAQLKAEIGALKVIMVGEGALNMQINRKIHELDLENTVVLAGRKSDVAEILSVSDLLLHTSYLEGTPNVVLEAQYLGVPVVATKGGGTTEAVKNNITGFIRDNNDKNGLVSACVRLLTDKHLYQEFSKAGPEFVMKEYNLMKMVDTMEKLYH